MANYVDPRITRPIANRLTSAAIDAVNEDVEGGVNLPIEISDVNGLEGELDSKASTSDIPDVSGLATKTELTNGLAGKANATHTHNQSQVSGLEAALNGKANTTHVHAQGDITGLVDALALKANVSQLPSANQLVPTPPTSGVYHLISTDGVISWEEVVE